MFQIALLFASSMLGADGRVDAEVCGRNALGLVAAWHKTPTEAGDLDFLLPSDEAPFSFADLERAAKTLGFETCIVRWSRPNSARFDCPAILRIRAQPESSEPDHFIASFGSAGDAILADDFPSGPRYLSKERLRRMWTGEMLYIEPRPAPFIAKLRAERRFHIAAWSGTAALAAAVGLLVLARRLKRRSVPSGDSLRSSTPHRSVRRLQLQKACCALVVAGAFAACAFIAFRVSVKKTIPTSPLVATPDLLVIEPKDSSETSRHVAFTLKNGSSRPVAIKHATSSCTCMAVKSIDGAVVAPGESQTLELDIALPQMGRATRSVRVYHDGADEPLVLQIRLQGARPLPFIARKINATPVFSGVTNAAAPQTVVVETREKLGSAPWLGPLACELDAVKITPLGMAEQPDEKTEVVVRKYSWLVAWRKTPKARETSGLLSVAAATDPPKSIRIGTLYARIGDSPPFLPGAVHLERGAREREIIIARQGSARTWAIDPSTEAPGWLVISPTEARERQAFEVRLADPAPHHGDGAAVIPLVSNDGAKWQLRIAVRFEPTGAAE